MRKYEKPDGILVEMSFNEHIANSGELVDCKVQMDASEEGVCKPTGVIVGPF